MKKFIVFLMVFMLLFMSIPSSVFAVTYGNVGPTTEFAGDVGTTGGYYINGTLVAFGDMTSLMK